MLPKTQVRSLWLDQAYGCLRADRIASSAQCHDDASPGVLQECTQRGSSRHRLKPSQLRQQSREDRLPHVLPRHRERGTCRRKDRVFAACRGRSARSSTDGHYCPGSSGACLQTYSQECARPGLAHGRDVRLWLRGRDSFRLRLGPPFYRCSALRRPLSDQGASAARPLDFDPSAPTAAWRRDGKHSTSGQGDR